MEKPKIRKEEVQKGSEMRWKNSESKNFRGLSRLGKALHLGLGDF
jgi:hypothetical protein